MKYLKSTFHSISFYLRAYPRFWGFAVILLGILLLNAVHTSYPDEFDNIAGGRLILSGYMPYSGFFTHHAPFAYFLAAFLNIFSGVSFVRFRIVYALFLWLLMLSSVSYFYHRLDKALGYLTATIWLIISVTSIYVWSQMLLADSLAGYLLTIPYLMLAWFIWHDHKLYPKQIALISSLLFLTFLTSFTYLYTTAGAYVIMTGWILKHEWPRITYKNHYLLKALAGYLFVPLMYVIYLTLTWSWSDFYYQAIYFNTNFYIYLPDDVVTSNPFRMAVVIFMAFYQNFRMILTHVKDFNIYYPFAITLALGHAGFWIYSGFKQRWWLVVLSLGMVIYTTARSNPLNTGETDYQSTAYQFLGITNAVLVMYFTHKDLVSKRLEQTKLVAGSLFVLTGLYLVFFNLAMFETFAYKAYLKYLGRHPLIYDRPEVAPVLNQILNPKETYYIGPFAFEEHYYMKARLASTHWITIPAMDKSERIQQELLADLGANQPRLILIDHSHFIFGSRPGTFLEPFLAANYLTLGQLHDQGVIEIKRETVGPYDLFTDWYVANSAQEQTLSQLAQHDLITQIN